LTSRDARKVDRDEEIHVAGGTISVQMVNELTNVVRWKMQMACSEVNDS